MPNDGVFDQAVAATYDRDHGDTPPETLAATIEILAALAAGGRALEFAVGTGRVALPLQDKGVPVAGIELSQAMVDVLRQKETGPPMDISVGDMTTTRLGQDHALVFLVFNTIDNLTTQEAQVACFQNAADHLAEGGRFLVETLVPPIQHLPFGETQRAFACNDDHWGIDRFDVTTQTYTSHHIRRKEGSLEHFSVPFRYAWPAELDLMARMAGLKLEHRWGDWHRGPFTPLSTSHISVWRKDAAA